MAVNSVTIRRTWSFRAQFITGVVALVLVAFGIELVDRIPEQKPRPVKTAVEAIAVAEECMRHSGYAGEPARDFWPRGNEIFVVFAGRANIWELRQSRALCYEPKAAAYEELKDRWIVGFPNRGGGDLGVQVNVLKDGTKYILHDPPSRMSYFKCQLH
jgi:hypothetical protein